MCKLTYAVFMDSKSSTFGEVHLVLDPGELVAMDGGLAGGVVGGHEAAA